MCFHKTMMHKKNKAGNTPPFVSDLLPNSIAETLYVPLGGMDQWVMIRGANTQKNPLLVMLHGGPGISETAFWRYFNSSTLEQSYTVVYWDQRGSGKSYYEKSKTCIIPKETMTVHQFLADLDELVDFVCRRLDKTKVVLFGHSWGSVLGPLYAAKFPNKIQAYIGCGQLGDWAASEQETYQYTLSQAELRHNRRAIRELRKIGPPPHDCNGLCTQRKWLAALEGDATLCKGIKLMHIYHKVPETSVMELFRFWKVLKFSIDAMWAEVTSINLIQKVPELQMPAVFLLGRHDHCVPSNISTEYIQHLTARPKKVIWFENSKHLPFVDEPAKFNATMRDVIRPMLDEN